MWSRRRSLRNHFWSLLCYGPWQALGTVQLAMTLWFTAKVPNLTLLWQDWSFYKEEVYDEFVVPFVVTEGGQPVAEVESGDSVVFFNFRPDRAIQLGTALSNPAFEGFDRGDYPKDLKFVTFCIQWWCLGRDCLQEGWPQKHHRWSPGR